MIFTKVIFLLSLFCNLVGYKTNIWNISWPLYSSDIVNPVSIFQNGYGDWCTIHPDEVEGFHPGVDFGADITFNVVNPSFENTTSIGYAIECNPEENILVLRLAESSSVDYGWSLQHIYATPWQYSVWHPEKPPYKEFEPGETITYCGLDPTQVNPWRHLHIQWIEDWVMPDRAVITFPGLVNPIDYLSVDIPDFEVLFKRVLYEEEFLFPSRNTGVWLMPDNTEHTGQIYGAGADYIYFQDVVSGAIDIAVSPFSAFEGNANLDSAGVYSVPDSGACSRALLPSI